MSRIAKLTLSAAITVLGFTACGTPAGPAGSPGPDAGPATPPGRGGPPQSPSAPDNRPSGIPTPSKTPAAPIPAELIGTWQSVSATGPGTLLPERPVRMIVHEDRFGLAPGCNQMGGDLRVKGKEFWVERLFSTKMACERPIMEQEKWVSQHLSEPTTWELRDGRLTLTRGEQTLTLERMMEHQGN